jgi:hypothetical protein
MQSAPVADATAPVADPTAPLTQAQKDWLRAEAAKLSTGDKRNATDALLNILGEVGKSVMWKTPLSEALEVAEMIIQLVHDNVSSLSPEYRRSLSAQIMTTAGYPGRIRQIMRRAGRLDELIRMLIG